MGSGLRIAEVNIISGMESLAVQHRSAYTLIFHVFFNLKIKDEFGILDNYFALPKLNGLSFSSLISGYI